MVKRGSKFYDSPPSRIPDHIMERWAKEDGGKPEGPIAAAAEHRQRLVARIRDLEQANTALGRRLDAQMTRIKHLEAVVYDVGPPPDAGMLEAIQ